MKILAIETSCDETAIAIVKASGGLKQPQFEVIQNMIASQIETHRPWGGVVPNLAKREHLKNLPVLFKRIMNLPAGPLRQSDSEASKASKESGIDLLAVTVGPGLAPCLWSGINFAEEIQKNYFPKTKLIGVNHLEGHVYSFLLSVKNIKCNNIFPAIALIVSGGHTIILFMKSLTQWKKLGETRDDAVGEAFDKVARMLKLPYPGGPEIEKVAVDGESTAIDFPRPMIHTKNYDFSFSGLKTSVLYYLKDKKIKPIPHQGLVADTAASFQQAAVDVLVAKTIRATQEFQVKSIMLSGGVAANKLLRKSLKAQSLKLGIQFFAPAMKFNTDNAVMIAAAAYINHLKKSRSTFGGGGKALRAQSNLNL